MSLMRRSIVLASIGAALAAAVACGEEDASVGIVSVPPEDEPPPTPPSRPDFQPASRCPEAPPVEDAGCSGGFGGAEFTCEYGHDLDAECNEVFRCSRRWQREPQRACLGRCPTRFEAIQPGAPCSDTTMGCSYPEGTCACIADEPDGGDGGDAADGGDPPTGRWRCAPPPRGGCPAQRPPIGADCVRPMVCDYGSCILWRDLTFACVGRVWIQSDTACTDGGGR